ncbi:hypothetical protein AX15_007740 [Amanita polypyramis BW_CC]|nr:hypothetical protein AX15_007740 [Amanita polypyramis BW_CC]
MKRFPTRVPYPYSQSTGNANERLCEAQDAASSLHVSNNDDEPRGQLTQAYSRAMSSTNLSLSAGITSDLPPKYAVPAIPHPYPYDHLVLVPTKVGLLMRPRLPKGRRDQDDASVSFVRIRWGKEISIKEVDQSARGVASVDWATGVVVYGIVGVLELFSCSYLLVITSRTNVGYFLDPSHIVYAIKNVVAIPLVEERARSVLNSVTSQNVLAQRPSLLPNALTMDDHVALEKISQHKAVSMQSKLSTNTYSGPKVRQGSERDEGHIRISHSPHSSNSDLSVPSIDESPSSPASPVIQAIVPRLSFWNKITKPAQTLSQALIPSYAKRKEKESQANFSTLTPLLSEELEYVGQEAGELERLIHEKREEPSEVLKKVLTTFALHPASPEDRHTELETKVVRECVRQFTKGEMYFSYAFDITHSLQHKQERLAKSRKEYSLLSDLDALPSAELPGSAESMAQGMNRVRVSGEPYPMLPLWRRVDRQFWWNEWLLKPFIDSGLNSYILPVMQGYYQSATFHLPPELPPPTSLGNTGAAAQEEAESVVEYTIISRRSRDRAGLRYQRRGIDDEARAANFVETETVMRIEREGRENVFSYVQIRGSIPLYWTQQGYGLKPPPMLTADRTYEQNMDALKRHFQRTVPVYGPHMIVNLAEQHGKEGAITQEYRRYVRELNSKDIRYHEYDFHVETRGMKYENISKLIQAMERTFDSQGYLWISDGLVFSRQKGVFRVNCIDCLDRTNVVQSAFARYVLHKQLSALAIVIPGAERKTDIDAAFNNVWANNGDAISRAYAGTSALKGDFTRTGKRDLGGMLNDGMNSLARMYSSTFSDWFCQAVIDYILGNRSITVFSEFLLKLQSTDPSDLVRLSKIRAEAIATSVSRVLAEGEILLSGWTLFAPEELNTKVGMKFGEKVLLLSARALYIVCYDYNLEEVKMYTRVPLGDIIRISKGAYILSPLEETSRDPEENAGFMVTWLTSRQESRINGYSIRNDIDGSAASPLTLLARSMSKRGQSRVIMNSDQTFAAFKVLPVDPARVRRSSSTGDGLYAEGSDEINNAATCREAVDLIVESIEGACKGKGGKVDVLKEDVVGLTEAEKMTSVYSKMEYGVKRLLWLGS